MQLSRQIAVGVIAFLVTGCLGVCVLTVLLGGVTAPSAMVAPIPLTPDAKASETRIPASIFATLTTIVSRETITPANTATLQPTELVTVAITPQPALPHIGQRTKTSGCVSANALPDPSCTPGVVFPTATKEQICTPGYSKSVRDVSDSTKMQVYAEYGLTQHSPGQYEVDHLMSLELGGFNDIANLWPEPAEPRPGFHEKDQVENHLHDQVCSSAMSLQEAQAGIANDWLGFYSALPAVGDSSGVATPTSPLSQIQSTATAAPNPAATPATTATTLNIGVVSLTSPAARNSNATLTIQTTPSASCTVTVHYKSGPSKAQGLSPKLADTNGQCSWTWRVGTTTTPGTWSVSVTATLNGQSPSLSIPFIVQ